MNKTVPGNERVAALAALSADDRKRLATYASVTSGGNGEEANDLLHDAFVRWLRSDKPIEGPEATCNFLRGAMNSIRSNIFRHAKVVQRYEGTRVVAEPDDEDDPVDLAADPAVSTDGPLFVQQVYDLCHDDEDVQLLLTAQADNATPDQMRDELDWDERKYKAVQKRKRRLVIRWTLEGKLT